MRKSKISTRWSEVQIHPSRPENYLCQCEYCTKNYIGDLKDLETGLPYTNTDRKKWTKNLEKHICPGHWHGYRFAIQKWTNPGDWVFDPTVGTGTTCIESINQGRNAIGIELEFPEIAKESLQYQYDQPNPDNVKLGQGYIHSGNAKNLKQIHEHYVKIHPELEQGYSLILNGTPYPVMKKGGKSSDAPERKIIKEGERKDLSFTYSKEENFGNLYIGSDYWYFITKMYSDCSDILKPSGRLVIIIKDIHKDKKQYPLHKYIVDHILESVPDLEYECSYTHLHWPPTLHMSTYNKTNPEAEQVALHQIAVVLKKKG